MTFRFCVLLPPSPPPLPLFLLITRGQILTSEYISDGPVAEAIRQDIIFSRPPLLSCWTKAQRVRNRRIRYLHVLLCRANVMWLSGVFNMAALSALGEINAK